MQNNISIKEYCLLGGIVLGVFWQISVAFIGVFLYLICRVLRIPLKVTLLAGLILMLFSVMLADVHVIKLLQQGFRFNLIFFKLITKSDVKLALYFQMKYAWQYLVGFPVLYTLVLQLIGKNKSVHADELKRMSEGKLEPSQDINQRRLDKALKRLSHEKYEKVEGIPLGISLHTYQVVVIPDYYINQILLVLGTTGSGKTVTLLQFAKYVIRKGYPLLWVDGKPTEENVSQIWSQANRFGRDFFGFNCGNHFCYNAFCGESYTELKDKIMTLKDHWESDYYRSIAEDYLQTTLEVLIKLGKQVDLKTIAQCLEFQCLSLMVRESNDAQLNEKIKSLQQYERQSLTGLQAHLNALINSELGEFLLPQNDTFTLKDVHDRRGVGYFALPALKFPSFAKVLGKLIINDIKSMIEPLNGSQPIFIIFDEFSVFAGEQVLNLVNMGRGKGVHAIFGTQGLSDLKKVDNNFENQLLNCVNTIICHRLNDQGSAESITKWIGTQDSYDVTAVLDTGLTKSNLGSLSKNKAFIVHPDDIKQRLKTGEAYFATKINKLNIKKIKIKLVK